VEGLLERILSVPEWLALLVIFAAPFLEASIFLGVIFPGEIAVLLGGVLASGKLPHTEGHPSLAAVLVAANLGAVLGDQVGYLVGKRWGETLLRRLPDRLLPEEHLQKSRTAIRRHGAKAVLLGRWVAALRAFVPGLAGLSGMHYRRFALANLIGGIGWATTITIVGYEAGANWRHAYHLLERYSLVVIVVIAVGLIGWLCRVLLLRSRRGRRGVDIADEAVDTGQDSGSTGETRVAEATDQTSALDR
jgi:membrane-associated protein